MGVTLMDEVEAVVLTGEVVFTLVVRKSKTEVSRKDRLVK
jgi:hypothetical protein